MPENYFLGALIQILNDGEFDGGDPYCVPRVSDIKEYTHAYRHIFR